MQFLKLKVNAVVHEYIIAIEKAVERDASIEFKSMKYLDDFDFFLQTTTTYHNLSNSKTIRPSQLKQILFIWITTN